MTGTLRLSAPLSADSLRLASGIAVRIEMLGGGEDGPSPWTVLVPADPRGLAVEVPAGSYPLQAWLPTGEILLCGSIVKDGEEAAVAFRAPVKSSSASRPADGAPPGRGIDLTKEYHPLEFQPAFTTDSAAILDITYLEAVELWGEHSSFLSWNKVSDGDFGEQLQDLGDRLVYLNRSTSAVSISSLAKLDWMDANRWWIRFRHSSGTSVGTLPLPWLHRGTAETTRAEIDVRFETDHQRLEVVVRDGRMDAVLAYLGSGRITAAEMAVGALSPEGTIMNALRHKSDNPLAACAAAYVSLATANRKQLDQWRSWTTNLMEWFPWMPDGAIIRACALMEGNVTPDTRREILETAKSSYRRGLPYFTVGLRHLREIFTIFGSDDPEAESMLNSVRSISARCDISETFTTLQFPSH